MTHMTESPTVRLVRTIPAPPERVYRAWLDPKLIRQWFSPASFIVADVDVDERVGGTHRISHTDDGVDVGGFESELLELVPGERIVFRWSFVGPDHVPDPAHDSLLTVELRPIDDGRTELTLIHERLHALGAAHPEIFRGVSGGWEQALVKLERALSS